MGWPNCIIIDRIYTAKMHVSRDVTRQVGLTNRCPNL